MKRYYSIPIGIGPGTVPLIRSLYNAPQKNAIAHVRAVGGRIHVAFSREALRVDGFMGAVGSDVFTLPESRTMDFDVRKGQQLFVSMPSLGTSSASVAPYFPEEIRDAARTPQPRTMVLRTGVPTCIVTAPSDRAKIIVIHSVGDIAVGDSPAPVALTELATSIYLLPNQQHDTFVVPAGQQLFAVPLGIVPAIVSILSADGVVDALTRGI